LVWIDVVNYSTKKRLDIVKCERKETKL